MCLASRNRHPLPTMLRAVKMMAAAILGGLMRWTGSHVAYAWSWRSYVKDDVESLLGKPAYQPNGEGNRNA